ncbi:MAG: hypothetical protein ACR2LK_06455 [Solirubrobacteraceae bacterium]
MNATAGDLANTARLERDDILHRKNAALLSADFETLLQADPDAGKAGEVIVTLPVSTQDALPAADFSKADLEIGGIRHSGSSYEGLVYLGEGATTETGRDAAAGYLGSFHVFGHGGCFGAEGHCDAPDERRRFDNRPLARTIRMKKRVDVTDAMREAAGRDGQLRFTIVARVAEGTPSLDPEGVLDVKRISIVTYR